MIMDESFRSSGGNRMIINRTKAVSTPSDELEEIAQAALWPQMSMMRRALWASPVRKPLLALALCIFLIVAATAYGQIRLNGWNQPFYDALSHRNVHGFLVQLGVFGIIAGALLVLNVAQRWFGETLKLKLREGLVQDLVENWMAPGRAFRLANAGEMGINPDQRMHEDARHLAELSADLGIGLLQDSLLLATFISVLWSLSSSFVFHVAGRAIPIPGYMVWAAVTYSGSASLLTYWVGRSLIGRNAERYAREADLRFSLVRVNEHIDSITLAGGEPDETRRIELDLKNVLRAMRLLVAGTTNLTWVTAGYGWFTMVAPILVAAPLYFSGDLTFGGLMMASGAFIQVQSSLRWFVDNFSTLADWRATLLRVASFRRALLACDGLHEVASRIDYADGTPGMIVIDNLEIASPAGAAKLAESHAEIKSGERVLVVGDSENARTLFFRALAGLWPWGAGRITRHAGEPVLYLPRTSYLPPGTLREVIAYPSAVAAFETAACINALERVGLERLSPMLDESRRWETVLSDGEHQSLAFARAVLHAPAWLIIDEALETLEADTVPKVIALLSGDLAHTGVLYIGRAGAHDGLFGRTLHLINDALLPDGPGSPQFTKAAVST
jgi:putative ATP-binding cassette transporter